LKIDKKTVLTMFVLASLITAMLVVTMNIPTSAAQAPDTKNLHGSNLIPTHMHYLGGILDLTSPISTDWHELYPVFCENWNITAWHDGDGGDGLLGPSDQIEMNNKISQEKSWFHVDRITWTLYLFSADYQEYIYVEYKGPYEPITMPICTWWHEVYPVYHGVLQPPGPYHIGDWSDTGIGNPGLLGVCDSIMFDQFPGIWWHVEDMATDLILNEKITDPVCTDWLELYPTFGNGYHIDGWTDNDDGILSPCDYVDLTPVQGGLTEKYHVEKVTLTLLVTLGTDEYYFEYNGTFETIYKVKIEPVCTGWDGIYPELYEDFHLEDWIDNCNGVLDTCDEILLQGEWVHVEELAIDIVVEKEYDPYTCVLEDGYKPRFNDYAPSGMPDFDQKQDAWYVPEQWTWCGPTAVANSLWWMDSRFEDPNSPPPPTISDSFVMVTRYDMTWDDHDPQNAPPFIEDLAWYMDTDGIRTGFPHKGTNVLDMHSGIIQYLTNRGLYPRLFEVNLMEMPPFGLVEYEIERCEDVILLLGLWQFQEPGVWVRFGGHYVTAAGVWSDIGAIAFSDPYIDNAEVTGLGRILPPGHGPHADPTVHNNATFVSQDTHYIAEGSPSPGGLWFIPDYYLTDWLMFQGQNDNPFFEPGPYDPMYAVAVEVEFMVSISPIPCKEMLLGDANGDGFANVVDLGLMSDAWLTQVGDELFDPRVDLNFDGFVNVVDLGILSDQWLKTADDCP